MGRQTPTPGTQTRTIKVKPDEGGGETAGLISDLASKTWEQLVEESYSHLNLEDIEAEFGETAEDLLLLDQILAKDKQAQQAAQASSTTAPTPIAKALDTGKIETREDGRNVRVRVWNITPTTSGAYGKWGPPLPIRPKYPPLVLRDLAEHDPDVSAGLDCYAGNVGNVRFTLQTRVPYEEFTDDNGNKMMRRQDTGRVISDVEWQQIQQQRLEAESFLNHLCPKMTLSDLRELKEHNQAELGNSFWTVIRSSDPAEIGADGLPELLGVQPLADDTTMRLCEEDAEPVEDYPYRFFEGDKMREIKMDWTFRRFVQVSYRKKRFFKSFGDKRFLDRDTGIYYDTQADAPAGARDAQEVIHFRNLNGTHYGRPVWTPAAYAIQTNKAARLVNRETLSNSGIPKMAVLITNSNSAALEKVVVKQFKKVRESGSREMVLVFRTPPESVGLPNNARPVNSGIEFAKLGDLQEKQGMFLPVEQQNQKNIGTTFRIPDLLYGRADSTVNRATAFILTSNVERQVFAPGRQRFDDFMNRVIFVAKGFNHWEFVSLSNDLNDSEMYRDMLKIFVDGGALMPNDLRYLSGELLDLPLESLPFDWANMPKYIAQSLASAQEQAQGMSEGDTAELTMEQSQKIAFANAVLAQAGLEISTDQMGKLQAYIYKPRKCEHESAA